MLRRFVSCSIPHCLVLKSFGLTFLSPCRPAAPAYMNICGGRWVGTCSMCLRQLNSAVGHCADPMAAVCAEYQTVTCICTSALWPIASPVTVAGWRWLASLAKESWPGFVHTSSASATVATRVRPVLRKKKGRIEPPLSWGLGPFALSSH